jgi:hypothetical protein
VQVIGLFKKAATLVGAAAQLDTKAIAKFGLDNLVPIRRTASDIPSGESVKQDIGELPI